MKDKVLVSLSMKADYRGVVSLEAVGFTIARETPKVYFVGDCIALNGDDDEQYKGYAVNYRQQFRKAELPFRENNTLGTMDIGFKIIDICEGMEDVDRVLKMHTKELINKMEQELQKRKKLLDEWVSAITN